MSVSITHEGEETVKVPVQLAHGLMHHVETRAVQLKLDTPGLPSFKVVSLGEDPSCWRDGHPVVYWPLETLLFDLLWELTSPPKHREAQPCSRIVELRPATTTLSAGIAN